MNTEQAQGRSAPLDAHCQRQCTKHRRRRAVSSLLFSGRLANLLRKLIGDEQGGEALEYAIVAGLIIMGAIGLIGKVGTKVLARWTSLNASM